MNLVEWIEIILKPKPKLTPVPVKLKPTYEKINPTPTVLSQLLFFCPKRRGL